MSDIFADALISPIVPMLSKQPRIESGSSIASADFCEVFAHSLVCARCRVFLRTAQLVSHRCDGGFPRERFPFWLVIRICVPQMTAQPSVVTPLPCLPFWDRAVAIARLGRRALSSSENHYTEPKRRTETD
jgi:hypothetical protein